ncbi:hypothetical protein R1flu_028087 [Riccia fluitans]|uniref:Uncharacterized protein n=1 Tax=Riccia fluitans TaxID=41844 RepID=A0ABD1XKP7_9MARC
MPAAMDEWRTTTTSGGSKESVGGDASIGGGNGGGGDVAGGAAPAAAAEAAIPGITHSKRQRRPSVRLGEIGDQKRDSKTDLLGHTGRWMSPSFVPRKSTAAANGGKLPRTRPLANVTRTGEQSKKEGSDEGGGGVSGTKTPPVAENSVATEEDQAATPSSTGRGSYGVYGDNKKASSKPGKRKRASSIRSSTIAKTLGVVSLNRKAKELEQVLAEPDGHGKADGGRTDMEEDSGAARAAENFEERMENGDTEVLGDDDGNGENSSGRQEGDEPESPGVRDNQVCGNGAAEPVQGMLYLNSGKEHDREQCTTSRLTDERKNFLKIREASMSGRRGEASGDG